MQVLVNLIYSIAISLTIFQGNTNIVQIKNEINLKYNNWTDKINLNYNYYNKLYNLDLKNEYEYKYNKYSILLIEEHNKSKNIYFKNKTFFTNSFKYGKIGLGHEYIKNSNENNITLLLEHKNKYNSNRIYINKKRINFETKIELNNSITNKIILKPVFEYNYNSDPGLNISKNDYKTMLMFIYKK